MTLSERLLALHRALDAARIPHAFGGAIALAFWTLDPRGTRDLDVNVFVPQSDAPRALAAFPAGVSVPEGTTERIARDGQVRLWWDDTPVDLFFEYAPIHEQAARNRRIVPFAETTIPVLGPVELAVFKAMFDRTKDWADIEALLALEPTLLPAIEAGLRPMVAPEDTRWARLAASMP